jgi:hypothetical protein
VRHPLHDRLMNATLRDVREATVRTVDALQSLRAEEQVAGIAAAFLLLCEHFNFPPQRALEAAENMLRQARYRDQTHFEAMRMYMREELASA